MEVICAGCSVPFPRRANNPATRYCSFECFKASRWRNVDCAECGKSFRKRLSEVAKAESRGYQHMCSRACRNSHTSKLLGGDGEWKPGGKSRAQPKKYGKDWPAAKAFALARDNHTCQQCGAVEPLDVHHWEPHSVSFNNDPDNLVTLCRECHKAKHEEYRREGFYADLQTGN